MTFIELLFAMAFVAGGIAGAFEGYRYHHGWGLTIGLVAGAAAGWLAMAAVGLVIGIVLKFTHGVPLLPPHEPPSDIDVR